MKHDKTTRMRNQVAECGRSQKTAELRTGTRTTEMTMTMMTTMTKTYKFPLIPIPNPCLVNISRTAVPHLETWIVSINGFLMIPGFEVFQAANHSSSPTFTIFHEMGDISGTTAPICERRVVLDSPHLPLSDNTWVCEFSCCGSCVEAFK